MYDSILLPVTTDTSETAVCYHVGELATALGADVTVLSVADTRRDSVTLVDGAVVDALEAEAREAVDVAVDVLQSLGLDPRTDVVQGTPAATIVDYADRYDYDLVGMPTHGRSGLERYLLGSVTEKVVRLSPVPVLTARARADEELTFPYEDLLVPVDGSESAEHAAEHAAALAATVDATVHVLSVVDTGGLGPDVRSVLASNRTREHAEALVDDVASTITDLGVADVVTHVTDGRPATAIASHVDDHDVHAIVMGTTGRRGADRVLLGSVAEKTVRTAPVPVLTVRQRSE
ncbi:universal stress protein [Halorubellus sp. JP-L1]|uniref:universal stress protein n=1 Tax=Halorubellus sp. JP-L1 TaxID=2715753 RepID=UPI0014081522|nr:universal stress protein [Halorubellus sp. JP-L1]NHN43205.1 universal stress protein [Halorubellus sp. JP-L1]